MGNHLKLSEFPHIISSYSFPGGADVAPLPPDLAQRRNRPAPALRRPGGGRPTSGAATAGGADLGISGGVLPGGGATWHGENRWMDDRCGHGCGTYHYIDLKVVIEWEWESLIDFCVFGGMQLSGIG